MCMAIQVSAHEDAKTRLRRIVRVKSSHSAGRVCGRKSRSYGSAACTRRVRPALVFTRRYARACMCVYVCVRMRGTAWRGAARHGAERSGAADELWRLVRLSTAAAPRAVITIAVITNRPHYVLDRFFGA